MMFVRRWRLLLLVTCFGCAAAMAETAVYEIDTEESLVLVRVGRAGLVKAFGHDHVVASEHVAGRVIWSDDPSDSSAELCLPLQQLVVDKPPHRSQFGLDPEVSEESIASTTNNMQQRVLQSERHPWATVSAQLIDRQQSSARLRVVVTLREVSSEYVVPVELQVDAERLAVSGIMTLQHSDFDMKPFRAAGGLLRVAKRLELRFSIVARRISMGDSDGHSGN